MAWNEDTVSAIKAGRMISAYVKIGRKKLKIIRSETQIRMNNLFLSIRLRINKNSAIIKITSSGICRKYFVVKKYNPRMPSLVS